MMTDLHAERVRVTSTWAVSAYLGAGLLAALFLTGGLIVLGPERMNPPMPGADTPEGVEGLLGLLVLTAPIPVVLGARSMTGEYSHRTVVPTLLAQPRRSSVVLAKLVAMAAVGLLYGAVVGGAALVGLVAGSAVAGIELGQSTEEILSTVVRIGLVMALYTVVGVGIGALVPSVQASLVLIVGWFYLGESLLTAVPGLQTLYPWLPGGAAGALTGRSFVLDAIQRTSGGEAVTLLPPWLGATVLAGYGLVAALLALVITLRRDIV